MATSVKNKFFFVLDEKKKNRNVVVVRPLFLLKNKRKKCKIPVAGLYMNMQLIETNNQSLINMLTFTNTNILYCKVKIANHRQKIRVNSTVLLVCQGHQSQPGEKVWRNGSLAGKTGHLTGRTGHLTGTVKDRHVDREDRSIDRQDRPLDRQDRLLNRYDRPLDRLDRLLDRYRTGTLTK